MKSPLRKAALLCALIVSGPFIVSGQSGLFASEPLSALYRKAKQYNLVPMEKAVPDARIDMLYKVTSAAGRPLYLTSMPCLIHRATAEKLQKVIKTLKPSGYTIKIWDAWRPPEAHQALWDAVQDPDYVVPPSKGLSWHCYGISVDLTLVKLDGSPVEMPSKFDEFSDRAASNYVGGDPEIARRVTLLQEAMRGAGFRTIQSEWWHFDDMNARGGIRKVTAADLGIKLP